MKTNTFTFLFFLIIISNVMSSQVFIKEYNDIASQVSQSNITNNLTEYEKLGVKYKGTVALENTLTWIKNKYLSYGYVANQMVEDPYTYGGSSTVVKNLILTKVGTVFPNTYVIICGHYDSISGTGTNDNGSGTTTILEVARLLQNIPTEYSIKFINFSGEEDGLQGSQHYVSSIVNGTVPKMNIKLVINIDEVGGVSGLINDTVTCENDTDNTPSTNNALSDTYTNELIECVELYSPLKTYKNFAFASDYIPFENNNEIITGLFETNETTHEHTPTDLLKNMDPIYNYNVAKAATGAMLHFSKASTVLGLDEYNDNFQVSFFPIPTSEFLNINFGTLTEKEYKLSFFDLNGKVVLEKKFLNPSLIEKVEVNGLNKGIYLVKLIAGEKNINKKIIIE